jgi:hypothetical protein
MRRISFTDNQKRSLRVDKELGSMNEVKVTNAVGEIAFSYHARTYQNVALSAVIINRKKVKVESWEEAIKTVLLQLKEDSPKVFKGLKDEGVLNWTDSELNVITPRNISSGEFAIRCIKGLQWLIRMMGINLERVKIKYGRTAFLTHTTRPVVSNNLGGVHTLKSGVTIQGGTGQTKKSIGKKGGQPLNHLKRGQGKIVVCALCGAKVIEDNFQQHLQCVHKGEDLDGQNLILPLGKTAPNTHTYKQPQVIKRASQDGMTTCKYCGVQLKSCNVQRHLRKVHNGKERLLIVSCSQHQGVKQPPEKIYTVVNGEVIRLKNGQGEIDHTIARSSSDSEDTWIGMGHLARDNGRFGSIIGEDYAD